MGLDKKTLTEEERYNLNLEQIQMDNNKSSEIAKKDLEGQKCDLCNKNFKSPG